MRSDQQIKKCLSYMVNANKYIELNGKMLLWEKHIEVSGDKEWEP